MVEKSWQPNHEPPSRREEGKKGAPVTLIYYTVETREGGNNPETMLERRTALQQTRGIHKYADKRRPLTAEANQC